MQSIVHIRARDQTEVGAFLARLSPATRRARYLGPVQFDGPALDREVRRLHSSDPRVHTVLLAKQGHRVRGIGEYIVHGAEADRAEVALVVEDALQARGIGTLLFRNLEQRAVRRGITAFTGDVANDNYRVLELLRNSGRSLRMQPAYASSHFEVALSAGMTFRISTGESGRVL